MSRHPIYTIEVDTPEMKESYCLAWFDQFPSCQSCGKPSEGILHGLGNESFGHHCLNCAKKRLKAASKVREEMRDEN